MSLSYCEHCQKDTEDKLEIDYKDKDANTREYFSCPECNKLKNEATDKLWAEKKAQTKQKIIDCKAKGIPCCPKCASTSVQPVAKGFSLLTGFIGSGKTLNYCLNCGNKWKP